MCDFVENVQRDIQKYNEGYQVKIDFFFFAKQHIQHYKGFQQSIIRDHSIVPVSQQKGKRAASKLVAGRPNLNIEWSTRRRPTKYRRINAIHTHMFKIRTLHLWVAKCHLSMSSFQLLRYVCAVVKGRNGFQCLCSEIGDILYCAGNVVHVNLTTYTFICIVSLLLVVVYGAYLPKERNSILKHVSQKLGREFG